jgi:hypothetical protein
MTKTPCFGLITYAKLIDFRITTLNQPEIPQSRTTDDDLRHALEEVVSENAVLARFCCARLDYIF